MEPLEWLFVITAITLIFAVFLVNPLQIAINEAMQGDAQLQAQRLGSTINLLLTSPDGTSYTFDMSGAKCKTVITESFVRMIITPVAGPVIPYTVSLIKTDNKVKGGEFECKRDLELKRLGNELRILPG